MTIDPLEEIKRGLARLREQLGGPNITVCISKEYPIGRWRKATAGDDIYFMVHPATLQAAFAAKRVANSSILSLPILDLDTPPAEPGAFLKWSVLRHEIHRQVSAAASADRQLDKIFKKDSK